MGARDALGLYRAKRDFAVTPEPAGAAHTELRGTFVVQKHAATRLHYDFRLEIGGVLTSWAVTAEPSLDPAVKRLAVRTEDHPLDYALFEGTIPKGAYGGGTVMIWDRGRYTPKGDAVQGLRDGKVEVLLEGQRLKGLFALVRLKPRPKERQEHWLLIKMKDSFARRGAGDTGADAAADTSALSGRSFAALAAEPPAKRATGGAAAAFTPPQLATPADAPPSGPDWAHEIKHDGYRLIAAANGADVRLYTRNGHDWTARFPSIAAALRDLDLEDALLDGEAVVTDAQGRSDFGALQADLKSGGRSAIFMAFDLLRWRGDDLRGQSLDSRKAKLARLLKDAPPPLRLSDHVGGDGAAVLQAACAMGLEGIVSKRLDLPYRSGRGRAWTKTKCGGREDFVIGGVTPSRAKGRPFASLVLGVEEDGELLYRGRVGTGFDARLMDDIAARLAPLAQTVSPFADAPRAETRGARWVAPVLRAEIAFTEQTRDGRLRHPVFLGLREDRLPRRAAAKPAPAGDTIAGVRLTHPEKLLYPEAGVTKRMLAEYLHAVAEPMLRHAAGRPLSLVRCPDGQAAKCFFQRHLIPGFPKSFKPVEVRERGGGSRSYIYLEDEAGLIGGAQFGVLEFHLWGAPAADPDAPDRLVIDLDPAEDVPFADLRRAAQEVRALLRAAGLASFPLLTGGKGVHVVAPLDGGQDWPAVKGFASALARGMAAAAPDRFLAKASKAARRGRIFVDWMRNERGATAICPYSPRARAGATVAVPVTWAELGRATRADPHTVLTLPKRLAQQKADPWDGYFALRQRIDPRALRALPRDS